MAIDETSTMYGNPLSEFIHFLMDFFIFAARSLYFLLETLILTILPNRYRKLKVSDCAKNELADILFNHSMWMFVVEKKKCDVWILNWQSISGY